MLRRIVLAFALCCPVWVYGKIDLVTLPVRDQVQLTIYNPADLTLVTEQRTLTLKEGLNRLEFSWENTLIDPTSVQLEAPQHQQQVTLLEVTYPPNTQGSAIWTIESTVSGEIPVEISFFTSGIHWQSSYIGTLSPDEQLLQLHHFVRVNNRSGEDYGTAQTRLLLGEVKLLDEIATLARRQYPYGQPLEQPHQLRSSRAAPAPQAMEEMAALELDDLMSYSTAIQAKQVLKAQLSEYVLYTIEGTETIANQWGKRLQAFDIANIPVTALYRHDEQRYGASVQRLLRFSNDKAHQLGLNPLPEGEVMLFRQLPNQYLSFVGQTHSRYIPIEQKAEFDVGEAREVTVKPVLMQQQTENYIFDHQGNISGWDVIEQWQLQVYNGRDLPVQLELVRHTPHSDWTVQQIDIGTATYEVLDVNRFQYHLTLAPRSSATLQYQLSRAEGQRQQRRR